MSDQVGRALPQGAPDHSWTRANAHSTVAPMTVTIHDAQWTHYDVAGTTIEEVATQISQMTEAGQTHWQPTYAATRWEGQTIAEADVEVQISVSMPNWAGSAAGTPGEQAEWERFLGALHQHEQGHIDLVHTYLANADTLIQGNSEHDAAQHWHDTLQALQTASDQYDTGNNHGENEGTIITLP
jgi:predicted secreted Zn-dependent protease